MPFKAPRITIAHLLLVTTVVALAIQVASERARVIRLQEELAAHEAVDQARAKIEQRRLELQAAQAEDAPFEDWYTIMEMPAFRTGTLTLPTGQRHREAVIRTAELRLRKAEAELEMSEHALRLKFAKRPK